MTRKRMIAFCMVTITVLFVIACIPASTVAASAEPCSQDSLPLSLAVPLGERMYFLPPHDEVASFTPARKLYDLPALFEINKISEVSVSFAEYETCRQVTDLYRSESITPRAP